MTGSDQPDDEGDGLGSYGRRPLSQRGTSASHPPIDPAPAPDASSPATPEASAESPTPDPAPDPTPPGATAPDSDIEAGAERDETAAKSDSGDDDADAYDGELLFDLEGPTDEPLDGEILDWSEGDSEAVEELRAALDLMKPGAYDEIIDEVRELWREEQAIPATADDLRAAFDDAISDLRERGINLDGEPIESREDVLRWIARGIDAVENGEDWFDLTPKSEDAWRVFWAGSMIDPDTGEFIDADPDVMPGWDNQLSNKQFAKVVSSRLWEFGAASSTVDQTRDGRILGRLGFLGGSVGDFFTDVMGEDKDVSADEITDLWRRHGAGGAHKILSSRAERAVNRQFAREASAAIRANPHGPGAIVVTQGGFAGSAFAGGALPVLARHSGSVLYPAQAADAFGRELVTTDRRRAGPVSERQRRLAGARPAGAKRAVAGSARASAAAVSAASQGTAASAGVAGGAAAPAAAGQTAAGQAAGAAAQAAGTAGQAGAAAAGGASAATGAAATGAAAAGGATSAAGAAGAAGAGAVAAGDTATGAAGGLAGRRRSLLGKPQPDDAEAEPAPDSDQAVSDKASAWLRERIERRKAAAGAAKNGGEDGAPAADDPDAAGAAPGADESADPPAAEANADSAAGRKPAAAPTSGVPAAAPPPVVISQVDPDRTEAHDDGQAADAGSSEPAVDPFGDIANHPDLLTLGRPSAGDMETPVRGAAAAGQPTPLPDEAPGRDSDQETGRGRTEGSSSSPDPTAEDTNPPAAGPSGAPAGGSGIPGLGIRGVGIPRSGVPGSNFPDVPDTADASAAGEDSETDSAANDNTSRSSNDAADPDRPEKPEKGGVTPLSAADSQRVRELLERSRQSRAAANRRSNTPSPPPATPQPSDPPRPRPNRPRRRSTD